MNDKRNMKSNDSNIDWKQEKERALYECLMIARKLYFQIYGKEFVYRPPFSICKKDE